MAKRGELTPKIQEIATKFWGREITQTELRLYPYIYNCAVNARKLDPAKINKEEREVMRLWKTAGHFEDGLSDMNMTKELFTFISEMLWYGYFVYDSE